MTFKEWRNSLSIGGKISESFKEVLTISRLKWLSITLKIMSGERTAATFVSITIATRETHATTSKAIQAKLNLHQFMTAIKLCVQNMTNVRKFGLASSRILTIMIL